MENSSKVLSRMHQLILKEQLKVIRVELGIPLEQKILSRD